MDSRTARSFSRFVLATIVVSAIGILPLTLALAGAPLSLKTPFLIVSQISACAWLLMMFFGFVLFGRRTGWLLLELPAATCGLWLLAVGLLLVN